MTMLSRTLQVAAFSLATICTPMMMVAARPAALQNSSSQPDNTAQNKNQGKTADNQSSRKDARLMTASVRKAIIADKSLSMYAHNVKIITMNGTVTLKGPVKSDEEKQKVVSDAASVVSQDKIVDHLTVKQ